MSTERKIRILAGSVILGSVALTHFHHPNWMWLTVFAGANLFQSGFTNFCLPEIIMGKLGGTKG